jgi:hypothetical protein
MADNVELDPGSGGAVIATDDDGTAQHQYVKLEFGGDGTFTKVATGNPLPVVQTGTPGLPTGAATAAKQPALGTAGSASADVLSVQGVASMTALKTDGSGVTQPVSGSVTVGAALPAGNNNIGDVDIASALPAGTNAIGKLAANSGVDIGDVDVTSISAGANLIGDVGIKPRTSGGLTPFKLLDIDETEDEIKATAGQVFGWYLYNDGAAEVYVKFYNATAANVTVGTTTPVFVLPVPAGAAANVFTDIGIPFSTAICIAATTGAADANTGAPATDQVVGTVFFA